MSQRWDEITAALSSGDADAVSRVIDDLRELAPDERSQLLETGFQELAEIYARTDDGYVRQSTVRVVEQFVPGVVTEFLIANDSEAADRIADQVDMLCGFLLETIQDDDGRVRQSTKRALKDVYRSYEALDDEATIEALIAELDSMAADAPPDRRKHLLETKQDAEFTLQSPISRFVEAGVRRFREGSMDR